MYMSRRCCYLDVEVTDLGITVTMCGRVRVISRGHGFGPLLRDIKSVAHPNPNPAMMGCRW